jgi:LacI family transcriptional regulator
MSTTIRPPTILDLAARAGVSKATVSRVLNDSPNVAAATRTRVLAAIAETGFQVNHAARTLRTSRTGLVGFLVPIISIFGLIVEALDRDLAAGGLSILLTSSRRRNPDRDLEAIETLVGRGVDALVLAPSDDTSRALARHLRAVRAPVVLLDREVRGLRADALLVDQGPGIHGAVAHLRASGRKRIALLTRDRKTRPGREIIARYEEVVRRRLVAEFDDLDREAGRDGVDRLLAAGADAIVATGTMEHTASVLERLGELGVRVPADVSLVVYGHLGSGGYNALPTVAYPVEEIASGVARLLLARLAGSTGAPRVELAKTVFVEPA